MLSKNIICYPQHMLHRSSNYITLFDSNQIPYIKPKKLCYTVSKGTFLYKSHSEYGMVGTSSASYLGKRKRI